MRMKRVSRLGSHENGSTNLLGLYNVYIDSQPTGTCRCLLSGKCFKTCILSVIPLCSRLKPQTLVLIVTCSLHADLAVMCEETRNPYPNKHSLYTTLETDIQTYLVTYLVFRFEVSRSLTSQAQAYWMISLLLQKSDIYAEGITGKETASLQLGCHLVQQN